MDGKEAALQIQELMKKGLLAREPFVISISSICQQVTVDEGKGNFQIVLPKPITGQMIEEVIRLLRQWWTAGVSRALPAWKTFDASLIDVCACDDQPVCRLSSLLVFQKVGVLPCNTKEVDDIEELIEYLE